MIFLGLLVVLLCLGLLAVAWMGASLLILAHRMGEPGKRPRRRAGDGPPPPIH